MKPIKNKVLIRPCDETTTVSGIVIGRKDRKDTTLETGYVMAVGKEVIKSIRPDQKVCYERYSGVNVTINDMAMLSMPDTDVLGIFQ